MSWEPCNSDFCYTPEEGEEPGLISAHTTDIVVFINCGIIYIILSFVGIVTNIINMIVFRRMGFSESINISLFALALSDLFSLLTLCVNGTFLNPYWRNLDLNFNAEEISYIFGGWPHVICIRVTGWLTAFVSFERFMSISKPLKVKMIFTPRRVKITIAIIYIVNLSPPLIVLYYTHRFVWMPINNGSSNFLTVVFSEDREQVEGISSIFTQNISPILVFVSVVASTITLVMKLNEKRKWRQSAASTSGSSSTAITSKDSKAAKMVTIITVIFIICFFPTIIGFSLWVAWPTEFHWTGRLRGLMLVFFSITYILEGVNSNVNFFIYYRMSSKFKQSFNKLINAKGSAENSN